MSAALAIFVKTPGLSPIKTRLAASIGTMAAESFHRQAAACVAATARAAASTVTPYWAVAERAGLDDPSWRDLPRLWQGEGDLGARMERVYGRLLREHGAALLIGADVPQATVSDLAAAVDALGKAAAPWVVGPAEDGGFWLVGGRAPIPPFAWCGSPWGRSDTLARFCARLSPAPAFLRVLRDVDTAEDLSAVRATLSGLPQPLPEQRRLQMWIR